MYVCCWCLKMFFIQELVGKCKNYYEKLCFFKYLIFIVRFKMILLMIVESAHVFKKYWIGSRSTSRCIKILFLPSVCSYPFYQFICFLTKRNGRKEITLCWEKLNIWTLSSTRATRFYVMASKTPKMYPSHHLPIAICTYMTFYVKK
jgi:hypothetical protein